MQDEGFDPTFEEVTDMVREFQLRHWSDMGRQVLGVPVILAEWEKAGKVIPRMPG